MPAPKQYQIDNLDIPPVMPAQSEPWAHPTPRRADWRAILAWGGVAIVAALLAYWLLGRDLRDWLRYGDGQWVGKWVPFTLFIVALMFVIKKWVLVRQPGGVMVPWFLVDERRVMDGILQSWQTYAARKLPNVGTYNLTEAAHAPTITTTISAPQLEDGTPEDDGLIPDTTWMGWVDQTPHLLLSARTNAGKTTMAMAILAARAGEPTLILDPHDQPDKWFGLRAIGGGRDFEAILAALAGVLRELDRRYVEYDAGKRTEDFDRLTVLIDETPALVSHTMDGQKTIDARWKKFAKQLGSEARKVRISVILLTQSPLVQDIQISTFMRENFTRIALGDQVSALLSEEKNTQRRSALAELLRGRDYAAAMEYRNEIHVLNTDNVKRLGMQTQTPPVLWMPPRIAVSAHAQPSTIVRASVRPPKPPMPASVAAKPRMTQIAWLGGAGYTTREIRAMVGGDHNEIIKWAKIGREAVER